MNTIIPFAIKRALAAGCVLVLCASLGACIDEEHYLHHDMVSSHAGDAIAVNAATQTIDPWPKESKNSKIDVDGKRLALGVERYQENKSIPPRGLNNSSAPQQQQQQQAADPAPASPAVHQ
jgi:hypothetical protein